MDLLVQPEDGFAPVLRQIKSARRSIDTTIFRFDLGEVEQALEAAVTRGVQVRALVAHTNSGGEKLLRKLETRLLAAGVILARSDDDLVRYHGKILIVDRRVLHLMLYNYTRLDTVKSRSFSVITRERRTVQEALKLFESDLSRQPYVATARDLVVSPENSRPLLSAFLKGARRQLLIYDPKLTDAAMVGILEGQAARGLDVRVLGHLGKRAHGVLSEKLPKLRLHARVIVRDGTQAFLGSQSLRKAELDERREVGLIVRDRSAVRRLRDVFESDWALTGVPAPEDAADERHSTAAPVPASVAEATSTRE